MPQSFGTQFGRREVRAADSAATGHVQTVGDLNFYNWIGGQPGAPAPHHILGLALFRKLTKGLNPQQLATVESRLNQAGLSMGDHGENLEGLGQDPGSRGKNTLTGQHYEVHLSEDELIKKLGYSFKKKGTFLYDTPITEIDPDTRANLILSAALQIEANKDAVVRRHAEKFRNDPNYRANIEKIRQDYADYPQAPGPNPERTIGSARTVTNPEFLAAQDPNTAEVMVEANRRQLTTPYTGKQQVPAADAEVNPVVNEIITPKPKPRPKPTPTVTPTPTPTPTTETVNPFRNRLMGPNRRGWSQPYSNQTPTTKRKRGALKVREFGGGPSAFEGLGHDPTEYIPRGRTVVTGDGPDAVSPGFEILPTLPIAIP